MNFSNVQTELHSTRTAFFFYKSTFQPLDKPWSQVTSLLPPQLFPSIFITHRVQQILLLIDFSSRYVANSRSRDFPQVILWTRKSPHE